MKMQYYLILLALLSGLNSTEAQVLLSPFGTSMTDGQTSHCFSGGEVVITTLNNADQAITQGFQQPETEAEVSLEIVNGIITEDPDNNLFTITNLTDYPNNRVVVLNRWGDIVFEASPYENDWDGTYEGRPLPAATYYYIIYLNDQQTTPLQGNLYILNP